MWLWSSDPAARRAGNLLGKPGIALNWTKSRHFVLDFAGARGAQYPFQSEVAGKLRRRTSDNLSRASHKTAMPDQNDSRSPGLGEHQAGMQVGGPQVPDLIEQYRVRRDAWIAQADELARLRDEVRGAAEREAMEIVTAARRDVRQVIMEARRELLVLSAQVQAALGEVNGRPDPATLLKAHASSSTPAAAGLPAGSMPERPADILVPEAAVKTMLDEARADMEALTQDAKTVPFQATAIASQLPADVQPSILAKPMSFEPAPPQNVDSPQPSTLFETLQPHPFEAVPPAPIESNEISTAYSERDTNDRPFVSVQFESIAALPSSDASRVLLSSPFPSDAVPVPSNRSLRTFVSLFVAVGVVVLGGSFWWVRAHSSSSADANTRSAESPNPAAASAASSPSTAAPSSAPVVAAKQTSLLPLSVVVEARRQSWIRTTVDGESDLGRNYIAGEKLQLNARHGISLRVGDAGAVFVSVNKGVPQPLGQSGQVMTRQFVADTPPSTASAPLTPSAPPPSTPKLAAPPASVPTASASPAAPLPGPLVQSPPPRTAAAVDSTPAQAIARRDASPAALPRTESTTVPPPFPTAPPVAAPSPAAPPAPAPVTAGSNASPATAVVAAARQWLDAYHRQERSTMAALSTENLQLADERRADERFPANVDVNRSLDRVSVQIAADTAVLTAVMTERGDAGAQRISPVSQVWILSGGQWRVKQVRLVSEARLNQIFR